LDVALGLAPASTPQSVRALQAASQGARGFAVLDGEAAQKSQELGAASRALAGLAWVGLRWRGGETVEVGIRRSQGSFGASATPLPLPPATALAIARDASLGELLALPPDLPPPDGGLI